MDLENFIQQLPELYENWQKDTIKPHNPQFSEILQEVKGMTTPSVMQLLNWAVECLEEDEVYCEIGCFQGSTLIGALLNHPDTIAYAVDNFSEFDSDGQNFNQLVENLTKFNLEEQVFFCNQDFEEFFTDLKAIEPKVKIGVYLYDGAHDYRSQLLGLLLVRPFLADRALIIVDDSNWTMAQQANWDFINSYAECNLLMELLTPQDGHHTFWNGLHLLSWDVNQQFNDSWQEIKDKFRNTLAIKSIYDLHFAVESQQKPQLMKFLLDQALSYYDQGEFDQAIEKYQQVLSYDKCNPYIYNNIASIYFKKEQYEEALKYAQISVDLDSSIWLHQFNFGKILDNLGENQTAIKAYKKSLELNPNYLPSYINLGQLLLKTNQLNEAELIYEKIITLDPKNVDAYISWGDVLVKAEKYEDAINKYEKALLLSPKSSDILSRIAHVYEQNNNQEKFLLFSAYADYFQEQYAKAVKKFDQVFQYYQKNSFDYAYWGYCHQKLGHEQKAREIYNQGLNAYPRYDYLFLNFLSLLADFGHTEADLQLIDQYAENAPDNLTIQLEAQRFLPRVYQDLTELNFYHERVQKFFDYLDSIKKSQELAVTNKLTQVLNSIHCTTNFQLQYQYKYEVYKEQQKQYGDFVHYVMCLKYPQWVSPLTMPSLTPKGKIKIGYLSEQIGDSSLSKWVIGWLKNANRDLFEIYCYATSKSTVLSETTKQIQDLCDYFYYIPDDLEATAQQILNNELHILVFLAIGLSGATIQLASLKLAPIQCTTWGHPSTSGLPTIDYYLSGDLFEPSNAQDHYTEKLVRLSNMGVSYPKPVLAQATKTRADFKLSEDQVIYLSCQLVIKYLPQYDYIFPQIALKVPNAHFLFIFRAGISIVEPLKIKNKLYNRLQKAFLDVNLNIDNYCTFLPNQNQEDYASLLSCVDVFLDTFTFSGGHTTFDAVASNLPIVTCAGELMFGRQSYGILKMLEVEETIAYNEQEYINIAVKLGLDQEFKQKIKAKMKTNQNKLFDDVECVKDLEQFYQTVVKETLEQQSDQTLTFADFIKHNIYQKKILLHVGCGYYDPNALPEEFTRDQWLEIRLDIDPNVKPDLLGTITDLSNVPDHSVDGIYSSHNLEHIESHEVPIALAEFYRVLKIDGLVFITLPDIQKVAEYVSQGKLEETLYISPAGPISAIDILYGLRSSIAQGNYYMAHRTAFTAQTLEQKLSQVGFKNVQVMKDNLNLFAKAYKL